MKKVLFLIITVFLGVTANGQIGTMQVNPPTPNPIPVGGTGTGTFILVLAQPWAAGEVAQLATGNPAYPITSITAPAGFDAWNLDDPTNGYTFNNVDLLPGTYTFTYVLAPTGTVADPVGTSLQASFGNIIGVTPINATLPVSLASFQAYKEGGLAQLTWSTTEEAGAGFFEIDHSADAKNWRKIGVRKAVGNGKGLFEYGFSHLTPGPGLNYYRLKMVDNDGSFEYSNLVSVAFEGEKALEVFPNPSADRVFLKNSGDVSSVSVINSVGRTILRQQGYSQSEGLTVGGLPRGIYFVKVVRNDGSSGSHKVVVGY